jgi:hypothetical protein
MAPRRTRAQKNRLAGAQLVVEHAAEEDDEDGRHGIGRVEVADGAPVQVQGIDEGRRQGPDAVVGEVAAQDQQADEHQDGEAVGPPGGMEEPEGCSRLGLGARSAVKVLAGHQSSIEKLWKDRLA